MEMQLFIIFVDFSYCFWDFTKACLKQSSVFPSSQSQSIHLHAKLEFTWQYCLITKKPIVFLMRKFPKWKLKHPCSSGRLWCHWLSQTSDQGSQICRMRWLTPAPDCVGIIMKLVFPSKFPIIRGTLSVCVKLYINIIF